MTANQRAKAIVSNREPWVTYVPRSFVMVGFPAEHLEQLVTDAIREAEAAMKERCAKTVEGYRAGNGESLADVIRRLD